MDPTETLQKIRGLCLVVEAGFATPEIDADLVEHVRALDEWMSTGGFTPNQWARKVPR